VETLETKRCDELPVPLCSKLLLHTDGVVTGFVADASTAGFDVPSNRANLPTVDSLLREAARAEREATGARGIIYDPETGVPTFAHIDFDKNAIDDEIDWTITDFTPTSAA
jgi:hypothetical protein